MMKFKIMALAAVQLLFVNAAMAANTSYAPLSSPITDANTLLGFMCTIIGYFFWFILALSVIMILYAAFTYVTAGDDTEKTSKARRIIMYAAVGILVAILSTAFPVIVNSLFSNPSSIATFC